MIVCPKCSNRFRVTLAELGEYGKCPQCASSFQFQDEPVPMAPVPDNDIREPSPLFAIVNELTCQVQVLLRKTERHHQFLGGLLIGLVVSVGCYVVVSPLIPSHVQPDSKSTHNLMRQQGAGTAVNYSGDTSPSLSDSDRALQKWRRKPGDSPSPFTLPPAEQQSVSERRRTTEHFNAIMDGFRNNSTIEKVEDDLKKIDQSHGIKRNW
jgi:hypothetical protein